MSIGSATNRRSLISSFIDGLPAGNSLGMLHVRDDSGHDGLLRTLTLAGVLNSFSFDAMLRHRLGGLNINSFVLAENPLPRLSSHSSIQLHVASLVASLSMISERFARQALRARRHLPGSPWRRGWAATRFERLRAWSMLDALVASWYGLDAKDFGWILRECDWPQPPSDLDPKGFWRVDNDQPPELRHTVLAQVAFRELERDGLEHFVQQNHGQGWTLPETLRLADYDLGHDDRARHAQPVASALGPRFHDWQLTQGVEESWEECQRHAELLEQILPLPACDRVQPRERVSKKR
jgi:hypothetical protein